MRVLVDANIYISYLLIPFGDRDPNVIVEEALAGAYVPLLVPELVDELHRKVRDKRYLAERITGHALDRFVIALGVFAETLPPLGASPPAVGRDRKDDYLFAHAAIARADFIASGDNDVVSVGQVEGVGILSTAEFARMLRAIRAAMQEFDSNQE